MTAEMPQSPAQKAAMEQAATEQAIAWHIRLRDGDDATWDAFVEWLAADPAHRDAYNRIEADDASLDPLLPDLIFREGANDDGLAQAESQTVGGWRRPTWALWTGGAIAASLAALLIVGPRLMPSRYEVVTGPGEHREIALDGATKVILNGSTRITLDRRDPRFAALTSGEALFQVHHDEARPFRLTLGDRRVVDLGTVFDVVRDSGGVRVAVAEGKVAYEPAGGAEGQAVPLAAGQALSDPAGGDTIHVGPAPAGSVGGWHSGRLIYAGAPLTDVARDIGRTLGLRLTVAPSLAQRPVSGSIELAGRGADEARRLGAVLDVTIVVGPDGWALQPSDRDAR